MSGRRKFVTWQTLRPIVPLVALLTAVAFIWYMIDRPTELAEAELRTLIAGNTLQGVWGEANLSYRQYVDPAGSTLTSVEGGPAVAGAWHIEPEGRYCADLVGQGERCYPARTHQDGYLWLDEAESLGYPFRVLQGKQIEDSGAAAPSGFGKHAGF